LKKLLLIPVLALFVALAGCQSSVVRDLDLVVTASEAVVTVLAGAGVIPVAVATAVDTYMGDVTSFENFAQAELASSDSAVIKAEKIAAEVASIAKPNLPSGTPQVIVSVVQAVVNAVANFLSTVQTTARLVADTPYADGFTNSAKPKPVKLSKKDIEKVQALHPRVAALKARFPKKQ
jgi:hypothetical protein